VRRVLDREELERWESGGTVRFPPGTIVTPLAQDYADEHGISLMVDASVKQLTGANGASAEAGGDAEEEAVVAAVVGEIARSLRSVGAPAVSSAPPLAGLTPRGAPEAATAAEHLAQCMACPNLLPDPSEGHRAIVSSTGLNAPGIVARLSSEIAACDVDILDISQTIVAGFFTMLMVVDLSRLEKASLAFADFRDRMEAAAKELGIEVTTTHEKVLHAMQRL